MSGFSARGAPPGHRAGATSMSGATRRRSITDARIIFKDFENSNWTWDPVAKAYYWHRFYSHQPDLNWDNPEVKEAMFAAMDFWLDMGVDGLRLDAVPYLYEREGTNCENLPETHQALRELRKHVDEKYRDRMLLAEANQWPEDAVAYFGNGDECHMAFHFPVMPRLFMSLRMEDRYPVTDILKITPAIPESCQWAMFLRNHDELTLEMVTDEERDYMYRSYARDREMRINLGHPPPPGSPAGKRSPPDRTDERAAVLAARHAGHLLRRRNRHGRQHFSGRPQWRAHSHAMERRSQRRLLSRQSAAAVSAGEHRPRIPLRSGQRRNPAEQFALAAVVHQAPDPAAQAIPASSVAARCSSSIPAIARCWRSFASYEDERVLVVANLSRFAQSCELDLSQFNGRVPVEVFGHSRFPNITDQPYPLSLGPHAFYWFHLQPREAPSR